jgi:23S rRNA (uracil1939-C5)-methyltransferase
VTVETRGLAVGGAAVGRVTGPDGSPLVGMTAFVPFAAPGESVRAAVRKRQSRFLEADLLTVETASPERVEPRCPYFGMCGGCDVQHLSYDAQLLAKRDMVRGALRAGGLGDAVTERVAEVVPGPPYGYRQRITLHLDKTGRLGYFRRRSHTLFVPETCPISVPAIDAWLARGFTLEGILTGVEGDLAVEAAENGIFGVLRIPAPRPPQPVVEAVIERMAANFAGGALDVGGKSAASFGTSEMVRRMEAEEVHGTAGVFSQVNPAVNAKLVGRVVGIAQTVGAKTAHDLYAGAGNFALPLADAAGARVFAVESDPVLVTVGRSEAARRGLNERVFFVESDMEKFLRKRPEPVDLVVADPPRAGLGDLAERMDYSAHLALISCHLPSAVRDLKALLQVGWEVREVVPFDMFAQTAYVELLSVLERKG